MQARVTLIDRVGNPALAHCRADPAHSVITDFPNECGEGRCSTGARMLVPLSHMDEGIN